MSLYSFDAVEISMVGLMRRGNLYLMHAFGKAEGETLSGASCSQRELFNMLWLWSCGRQGSEGGKGVTGNGLGMMGAPTLKHCF